MRSHIQKSQREEWDDLGLTEPKLGGVTHDYTRARPPESKLAVYFLRQIRVDSIASMSISEPIKRRSASSAF
jgi:hypothetical protein